MALNNTIRARLEAPPTEQLHLPDPNALPKVFGHNWQDPAFRKDHSKKQTLMAETYGKLPKEYKPTFVRGSDNNPPEVTSASAIRLREKLDQSMSLTGKTAPDTTTHPDSGKAYDLSDKVLRFYAYFTESLKESAVETARVRKVSILFFPVDNTVLVQEPRVPNSGMQGGPLIKRNRIPLSQADAMRRCSEPTDGSRFPNEGEAPEDCVTISDLNVGRPIVLFGQEFNICACDDFTRRFLTALGQEVPEDLPFPDDRYQSEYRGRKIDGKKHGGGPRPFDSKDLSITMESLGSHGRSAQHYPEETIRAQRFIHDSGKVFRFYAFFIDTENDKNGTLRLFEVRYFVEDDALSVVEHITEKEGAPVQTKTFVSRRRLPKSGSASKLVDITFGGRVNGQREHLLPAGDSYYAASDLDIGATVNVFGRVLTLYACDDYTREFYANQYGIDLAPSQDISHLKPKKQDRKALVPPPTGFGTPEDSMASCRSLILKPPKKDLSRWHEHAGEILRFKMRFDNPPRAEDQMRAFILNYYVDDGEIMVSEVPQRNTGFTGGKFVKKQRLKKAAGEAPSSYYQLADLVVGARLRITDFNFLLTEADAYTEKYLSFVETKGCAPEDVTKVSAERLKQLHDAFQSFINFGRFSTITEAFRTFDKDADGLITVGELKEVLANNQITHREEEAVALLRVLDRSGDGFVSYADFVEACSNPPASLSAIQAPGESFDVAEKTRECRAKADERTKRAKRNKLLAQLRDRLEARRLNGFEMFRMLSTMPRAHRGKKAVEVAALTNGAKDVVVTPVQMRRGFPEVLGMVLTEEETLLLLEYFFPTMESSAFFVQEDRSTVGGLTMADFHQKLSEMIRIGSLE